MSLLSICEWLQQTSTGVAIREYVWTFPIIETVHLRSLALSAVIPLRATLSGYVSLTLWMTVIVLGRGIAYRAH